MKTAMQELMEWAISLQDKQQQCIDWIVIKNKANELLEKEKEQIRDAYKNGMDYTTDKDIKEAEEYYNQTYNK